MNILLTKEGIDVNAKNNRNSTALHLAFMYRAIDCIWRLLEVEGIDVNAQDHIDRTALHYAVLIENPDLIRKLLEKGADPMIKEVCFSFIGKMFVSLLLYTIHICDAEALSRRNGHPPTL